MLSEALTVRIEPTELKNATINAWAVADLLNETLERYGEALGIGEENLSASSAAADTNAESNATSTNSSIMSNNMTANIANYADYQSTQGLVNMTEEMLNQIQSLLGGNSSTATSLDSSNTTTTTTTLLQLLRWGIQQQQIQVHCQKYMTM